MSSNNTDLNASGKPYHEHGDKVEKQHKEPAEHPTEKDITPHHGHDNQYHKDIKGSVGSGSSERGDRKAQ